MGMSLTSSRGVRLRLCAIMVLHYQLFTPMLFFQFCFRILFFFTHSFGVWSAIRYSFIHFCVLFTSLVKRSAPCIGFFFMCYTCRRLFFFIFLFHTSNFKVEYIKHAKWSTSQ